MGEFKDYYSILEIESSCDEKEIKKAFRKQALKYHPDKSKTDKTAEDFILATEAYEVLSDSIKRQKYDEFFKNYNNKTSKNYKAEDINETFNEWAEYGSKRAEYYKKCFECQKELTKIRFIDVKMYKVLYNRSTQEKIDVGYKTILVSIPHCHDCYAEYKKRDRESAIFIISFICLTIPLILFFSIPWYFMVIGGLILFKSYSWVFYTYFAKSKYKKFIYDYEQIRLLKLDGWKVGEKPSNDAKVEPEIIIPNGHKQPAQIEEYHNNLSILQKNIKRSSYTSDFDSNDISDIIKLLAQNEVQGNLLLQNYRSKYETGLVGDVIKSICDVNENPSEEIKEYIYSCLFPLIEYRVISPIFPFRQL